jgi:hypothetical protein
VEDIINMYHTEIDWEGVDWFNQAHGGDKWEAVVKVIMNLQVV